MSSSTDYLDAAFGAESQQRGFALYVGISETKARESGLELGDIVSSLRDALVRRIPFAECEAMAVVAPLDESAGDLEVVLLASGQGPGSSTLPRSEDADVVIDLARHRVLVDGQDLRLTFKEFALLQLLVVHAGRTISRSLLREVSATSDGGDVNDRTIDVRIRRLRIKLGRYPDLIRTVPGRGYRFDPRPDVAVLPG